LHAPEPPVLFEPPPPPESPEPEIEGPDDGVVGCAAVAGAAGVDGAGLLVGVGVADGAGVLGATLAPPVLAVVFGLTLWCFLTCLTAGVLAAGVVVVVAAVAVVVTVVGVLAAAVVELFELLEEPQPAIASAIATVIGRARLMGLLLSKDFAIERVTLQEDPAVAAPVRVRIATA
jgi:hypothetical protein